MIFLKVAIASGEKKASDAYAAAGDCSTEIFNSIRTVAAFCSEAAESKKYLACLVQAKEASKSKGWSHCCCRCAATASKSRGAAAARA
jgi:hypothetical protein